MNIGVLKEPVHENRVALIPEAIPTLSKMKISVLVEKGAGEKAFFTDEMYEEAGAKISSRESVISSADILVAIHEIDAGEMKKIKKDAVLIGVYNPLVNKSFIDKLVSEDITAFSLDMIPRISRGQSMDILSSMATVAGYKAVLESAMLLPKFFPMFMTAAGTITPAKVLVLGAGVAGLQAIAIARKLGASVEAFDVRTAAKEQVLSLGAKFVEVEGAKDDSSAGGYAVEQTEDYKKKQQQVVHDHAAKADVIISTAQIPGKKAPILIMKETIDAMKPGSVIIDLAASSGGNTELTKNDEIVNHKGVRIVGQSNYASDMPGDASKMFGKNLVNLVKLMTTEEGELKLDFEDEIVAGCCIVRNKEIVNERVKSSLK